MASPRLHGGLHFPFTDASTALFEVRAQVHHRAFERLPGLDVDLQPNWPGQRRSADLDLVLAFDQLHPRAGDVLASLVTVDEKAQSVPSAREARSPVPEIEVA